MITRYDDEPAFTLCHPDFDEWTRQIDWDLRYEINGSAAGAVISRLIDLGFTIIPPPMPRYALAYNGNVEFRSDTREKAERFLAKMAESDASTCGYQITDRKSTS